MGKYIGHGYNESEKLLTEIEKYNDEPFTLNQKVMVKEKFCGAYSSRPESEFSCTIKEIGDDYLIVDCDNFSYLRDIKVSKENCRKNYTNVGVNPFPKHDWRRRLHTVNFNLECITLRLFKDEKWRDKNSRGEEYIIKPTNWNPFVYDKDGNRNYYQRDFCWTLKEKQLLIDSIYNGVSCGMIVVRMKSTEFLKSEAEKGEKEVYEWDYQDAYIAISKNEVLSNPSFYESHLDNTEPEFWCEIDINDLKDKILTYSHG